MKRYEEIEHTADFGLKIYGRTRKELFVNAALGMCNIMADIKDVKPKNFFRIMIKLKAPDLEELLLSWLKEILFLYNTKYFLFSKFNIQKLTPGSIIARCFGEPIDRKRHILKREVKAVTRYEFSIKKIKDIWTAQLIFDT